MSLDRIDSLLNDELDRPAARSVEEELRSDAALREVYCDQAEMDRALRVLLGGENGAEANSAASPGSPRAFREGVLARLRSEGAGDERAFSRSVLTELLDERKGIRAIRWPDLVKAGVVAAAASIALMFLLQTIIFRNGLPSSFPFGSAPGLGLHGGGYVAQVESSRGATWSDASAGKMREDGWLGAGPVELDSGRIRVGFNSGATAVIEGPAAFSLETPNRLYLQRGDLTAEVPPAASGFAVNTPRMNVVDIGTRFGVSVDDVGNSEVHVMQGEVEASRSTGRSVPVLLREGLSLRADDRTRTDLKPIPYAGDRFVLQVGDSSLPRPRLFYPFEERSGSLVLDASLGGNFDTSLEFRADRDHSPRRAPGRNGSGLVFRGGRELRTGLGSSFRLEQAHTASFWVKISPVPGRTRNHRFFRFGGDGSGEAFALGCNFNRRDGVRGALRLDSGGGWLVGTSDLSDGQWHHVAYRFLGGEGVDPVSHVHLFVDGSLESLSGWNSADTPGGPAGELVLGSPDPEGFSGWVDDLKFYDRAIPTRAVQHDARE